MSFEIESILAFTWSGLFWNLGAIFLFFLGLVLVVVILMQDSKEGGLGGAFGGGMGGEILGARGQKDINRFTAILGGLFAVVLVVLGITGNAGGERHFEGDEKTIESIGSDTGEQPATGDAGEASSGDAGDADSK